jgi:hypothetical protein
MDMLIEDIEVDIRGKSNPASLKRTLYYTEYNNVVAVPALAVGANKITTALTMRSAVAVNLPTVPVAIPAGKFAKITASDIDLDFKVERLGEGDNHAGYKVMVKAFINGKTPEAATKFGELRNRRLYIIVEEKDGQRYLIEDIMLHSGSQVNPKRGYMLEGEVILSEEPPVITSPIPL